MRKTGAASGALLGKSMLKAFIAIGVATKIASFLGDSVAEAREANKVAALTNNVIKTTGGVAKVSAIQVNRLADALSRKTGIDDEQIATSENLLLTFKNIKREGTGLENIFNRATRASVDLSASGFGSMESTAKMLGKALNDPLKGLTALGRAGVTFTQQQQDQIKALVASGNALKAQKIILREVESQVGGAAAAQATNADKARVALGNLKEQIGKALVPALDAMAGVFANRIAPAISSFITNLQTGSGSAGRFATFLREDLVPVLQKSLPSVLAGVRNAFNQVRNAISDNRPQIIQIGNAIKKLVPVIANLAGKWLGYLGFQLQVIIRVIGGVVRAFNAAKATAIAVGKGVVAAAAFFTRFAEAVRQKFSNVVSFVKGIPAKIKAALGNLGSLLYNAGKSVIQGLLDGIEAMIGRLKDKLHAVTSLIPKHKGPPNKDKGLLYGAGQLIMEGLIDGIASKESALTKKLKEQTKKIRESLASVRSDFASLVEPIASNFTQGLFDFDTAGAFTANLTTVKGTLSTLLDNFKELIGNGLSPGFLYQLFQEGGPKLISSLAALDAGGQVGAGALFGQVTSLSDQLGTAVAGATDKGGALENQTVRLEKKLDKLIKATKDNAREVGQEVNGAAGAGHRRGKHGGRRAA